MLSWLGAETQFSVFMGKAAAINTAPTVATSLVLAVDESTVLRADLNYTDKEHDTVRFSLSLIDGETIPGHLTLADNGTVLFEPALFFHGDVHVRYRVVEDVTTLGSEPLEAEAELTFRVVPKPDVPLLFYLDQDTGSPTFSKVHAESRSTLPQWGVNSISPAHLHVGPMGRSRRRADDVK